MNDLCYPHRIGGLIAWTNRTHLADLAAQVLHGRRAQVPIRTSQQQAFLARSRCQHRLPRLQPRSQSRISSPLGRRNHRLLLHRLPQSQLPSRSSTRSCSKVAWRRVPRNFSIACASLPLREPPPQRGPLRPIPQPKVAADSPSYYVPLGPNPLRRRRNNLNHLHLRHRPARVSLPCSRPWVPRTPPPPRCQFHLKRHRSMRPHRPAGLQNCSVQRQSLAVLPARRLRFSKISRERSPSYSAPWAALPLHPPRRLRNVLRPPIPHPRVRVPSPRCSRSSSSRLRSSRPTANQSSLPPAALIMAFLPRLRAPQKPTAIHLLRRPCHPLHKRLRRVRASESRG